MEQRFKLCVESQVLILPPDSLMCNPRKCILQDEKWGNRTTRICLLLPSRGFAAFWTEHSPFTVGILKHSWTAESACKHTKNFGFIFSFWVPHYCKNAALPFHNIFMKLKSYLGSRNGTNGKRMTRKCSMCVRGGMFTPCLFVLGRNKVLCVKALCKRAWAL